MDIVTETVFDYPYVFVSEKILRPLLTKTPFIVFAAQGTLEHLKSLGFKTFSDFWDESYDLESDSHLRFLSCCRIINSIAEQPIDKLKNLYAEMETLLEHNRQTLITYINDQYRPLYKKINYYD